MIDSILVLMLSAAGYLADPEAIRKWIAELGHPRVQVRDQAMQSLWQAGRGAENAVRAATTYSDPEIAQRAKKLDADFSWKIYPTTPRELRDVIETYRGIENRDRLDWLEEYLRKPGFSVELVRLFIGTEPDPSDRDHSINNLTERIRDNWSRWILDHRERELLRLLGLFGEIGDSERWEWSCQQYAGLARELGCLDAETTNLERRYRTSNLQDQPRLARVLCHLHLPNRKVAEDWARKANDPALLRLVAKTHFDWESLLRLDETEGASGCLIRKACAAFCGNRREYDDNSWMFLQYSRSQEAESFELNLYAQQFLFDERIDDVERFMDHPDLRKLLAQLDLNRYRFATFHKQMFERIDEHARGLSEAEKKSIPKWTHAERLYHAKRVGNRDQFESEYRAYRERFPDDLTPESATETFYLACRLQDLSMAIDAGLLVLQRQQSPEHKANIAREIVTFFNQLCSSKTSPVSSIDLDFALISALSSGDPDRNRIGLQLFSRMKRGHCPKPDLIRFRDLLIAANRDRVEELLRIDLAFVNYAHLMQEHELERDWIDSFQKRRTNGPKDKVPDSIVIPFDFWRLETFLDAGRNEEALQLVGCLRSENPKEQFEFNTIRGIALTRCGAVGRANEIFAELNRLSLGCPILRMRLLDLLSRHGLSDFADKQLMDAQSLRVQFIPRISGFNFTDIVSHRKRNRYVELLAHRKAKLGQIQEAENLLRYCFLLPVLESESPFEQAKDNHLETLRCLRIRSRIARGEIAEAVAEAINGLKVLPRNTQLLIDVCADLERGGHRAESDRVFAAFQELHLAVLKEYPDCPEVLDRLAWGMIATGRDREAALKYAARAVEAVPNCCEFAATLAECHFRNRDRAKAIAEMRRCRVMNPERSFYRAQLRRYSSAPFESRIPDLLTGEP
jgi:tetratricopeptide (TPR) repeat protein